MRKLEKQPENKSDTVVGIAHFRDGKILLVRNKEGEFWYLPGGKVERGESTEGCLRREVGEELGMQLEEVRYYSEFGGLTPYSKRSVRTLVYLGEISGDPKASAEITEFEWTDRPWDRKLTDITQKVVERLRDDGFFPAEEQYIR